MGEVVNLQNVSVRQQPEDFAEWLEDMARDIREKRVNVQSLIVVMETRNEFTSYATANAHMDTARSVGLLHMAAERKTRGCEEDDPLEWRTGG